MAESYYAVEHGAQQTSSGGTKSVNAVHTGKPYRKGQSKQMQRKPQTGSDCGNCTKKHKPGCANVWLMSPYATSVDTLDTGKQNAEDVPLLAGCLTRPNPPGGTDNKGRKVGTTLLISMNMTANMMRSTCTWSMIIFMRLRWMTW